MTLAIQDSAAGPTGSFIAKNLLHATSGRRISEQWDLAELYEVQPRELVQAVKRNLERFPNDFMFQVSEAEFENLKSCVESQRSAATFLATGNQAG